MKKNLQTAAMLVALCLITGSSASICRAQKMVGGYNSVSKTDAAVIDAANFAVETQARKDASLELKSIASAERQIVAGSNYRLCLVVNSGKKQQEATAIVFLNLKDKFSLTSWTPGKCASAKTNQEMENDDVDAPEDESVTYKGGLEVGKTDSTILYVGEETGDYAAFCFANNSEVGRAVLKACKNGEQCEFTGQVDFESPCKVKNLEANLSASGKILSIESVKSMSVKRAATGKTTPVSSAANAPDAVVKNLYAAHQAKTGPFFQMKKRSIVDKYFSKDFADLIWKDAVAANGEVGAIDMDPLYNAQDMKITAFTIGKPEYDTSGNSGIATVLVSFKNFGKADTVKYLLERDAAKNWKISDIVYKNGDMLKGVLTDALRR